eukprot:TRINITY_DN5627_c0_g1_i3.p1 TRINITY_DN5627_c0_g1~~TRINITY_DN5627_c0_g1_i3.p1  ORF type:complete len:613 (+),score=101.57 TRINITY_DN5627_c0_g1_i3:1-1839(+)
MASSKALWRFFVAVLLLIVIANLSAMFALFGRKGPAASLGYRNLPPCKQPDLRIPQKFASYSDFNLLWPTPQSFEQGDEQVYLSCDFALCYDGHALPSDMIELVEQIAVDFLLQPQSNRCYHSIRRGAGPVIEELRLQITGSAAVSEDFPNGSNERYLLEINRTIARVNSASVFGIMRGLETFKQLVKEAENSDSLRRIDRIPIVVEDWPRFSYRGFLVDVARCYYSVEFLTKLIKHLASLKMNVLHLHFSDDDGFLIESKRFPKLACPNESGKIYTQEEIRTLIAVGKRVGVRIIPEIDIPGHAGGMFSHAPLVHCPHYYDLMDGWSVILHPLNETTYSFIEELLEEFALLFPDPLFHLGGDEVSGFCSEEDELLQNYKVKSKGGDERLFFQSKLNNITSKMNKTFIFWEEASERKLATNFRGIAQSWRYPRHALNNDMFVDSTIFGEKQIPLILSHNWYFFPLAERGSCFSWKQCYKQQPFISKWSRNTSRTIGGEAALWEEPESQFDIRNHWLKLFGVSQPLWSDKQPSEEVAETHINSTCPGIALRVGFPVEKCTSPEYKTAELDREVSEGQERRRAMKRKRLATVWKDLNPDENPLKKLEQWKWNST